MSLVEDRENLKSLEPTFTASLTSFAQKMLISSDLQNFLQNLQKYIPKNLSLGEMILFYESPQFGLRRAYIKNHQFFEETAKKNISFKEKLTYGDRGVSSFLAQEMGRPFGDVLLIPLGKSKACLFLEIRQVQKKIKIENWFYEREDILKMSFEKAFIGTVSYQASHLWKTVFGNLGEPLALLKGGEVVFSNQAFKTVKEEEWFSYSSLDGLLVLDDKIYRPQFYICDLTIKMNEDLKEVSYKEARSFDDAYVIFYGQDLTSYFNLREKLLQSEKMVAFGKLGRDMAHQLNNPLTGIRSIAQIFLESHQDCIEEFKEIESAALRSQKIINSLFNFSDQKVKEKCDVLSLIQEVLLLLKFLTKDIQVEVSVSESLYLLGDRSYLQQIIFNLIKNSCQAFEDQKNNASPKIQITGKKIDGQICLTVTDNGPGIPKKNLKKVFQPLFTTKKPGEGTGLGLGITKKFIEKLGGDLHIESDLEQGVTCFITFPSDGI